MSKTAITKEQQQIKLLEAKLTQANREVQQMELKIKNMHQQHEELQTKNANILRQSYAQQGAVRDRDKHEEQVRAMAGELAVTKSQLEAAKGSIKGLQMEREHLVARYNDDQSQWERLAQEFGEKEDQFRCELDKFQELIEDRDHVVQQQKGELLRAQQEVAEERRRISRIGSELTAEQNKTQKLETSLEDLTQEVSEMAMKLSETTNSLNEQLEVTRKDRKEMQTLKEKADYLNHRVEQLSEESHRKDSIISEMKMDLARRHGDIDEKDQSMRSIRNEMTRLQAEIDRLTKLNDQRVQMVSRSESLLTETNAKLRTAEDECIEAKEKLRACELERMTSKDEAYKAAQLCKQLQTELAALRDSVESKDGSARVLNDKINLLEKDLATERNIGAANKARLESQAELHKTQMEARAAEVARLKSEIASQQEHIDKIQEKHSAVDEDRVLQSNTIAELRTLLATETAANKSLLEKLQDLEEAFDSEVKIRSDAQSQLTLLKNEKISLDDEVKQVTNERDTLRGRLAACEDMLKAEQSKNRVATTDTMSLTLRVERLTRDLDHSQTLMAELKEQSEKEIESLRSEVNATRAKLAASRSEGAELNNAARAYRDRCRALESSLKQSDDSNKRFGKEVAALTTRKEEYKNLVRELTNRRDREHDFNQRLGAFHKGQIAALKQHITVLQGHLSGFVHFQKMVATAVAMRETQMEDFVGEEVWNEVLEIQRSTEKEKVRAEAEAQQLQKQYEALKQEYQQHLMIAGANNNASKAVAAQSNATAPTTAASTTEDKENYDAANTNHNTQGKSAARCDRDVSASVRPPTLSMQQHANTAARQTASQSAPRSLAMSRPQRAQNDKDGLVGDDDVPLRSAAPSNALMRGEGGSARSNEKDDLEATTNDVAASGDADRSLKRLRTEMGAAALSTVLASRANEMGARYGGEELRGDDNVAQLSGSRGGPSPAPVTPSASLSRCV